MQYFWTLFPISLGIGVAEISIPVWVRVSSDLNSIAAINCLLVHCLTWDGKEMGHTP